jgi:hypothetical protein
LIKRYLDRFRSGSEKEPSSGEVATITCPVCKGDKIRMGAQNRVNEMVLKCQLCQWEFVAKNREPEELVAPEDLSADSLATINRINSRTIANEKRKRRTKRRSETPTPEDSRPDPFFRILATVMLVYTIPILRLPFSWLETYFHELSHAIASLLTGGQVVQLFLETNGSGMVISSGGVIPIIAWAGYAGAAIWGVLIYLSALQSKNKNVHGLVIFLILTLTASAVLWVRDEVTLLIMLVLYLVFLASLFLKSNRLKARWLKFFVQFNGLYVLCNAIHAPLILLNIHAANDSITMQKFTQIPGHFWVIQWFLISVFGLYLLWAVTYTRDRRIKPSR